MRLLLAALVATSLACTHHDKESPTTNPTDELVAKSQLYLGLGGSHVDEHGFDTDDRCDGLLWSCLRMMGGAKVDYVQAMDPNDPGRWYRDSHRSCTIASGAKSEISRDMLDGLAFCLWQAADVTNTQATLDYADAHGGVMGEGPPEIVRFGFLLPHLYKAIVAKALSTPLPDRPEDPDVDQGMEHPKLTKDILVGFRAHIAMIGILLDGSIYGGLTTPEMYVVKDQAKRQPRNALYQAILHKYSDGDQSAAIAILMEETLFPADRLPTTCERSSPYLWERDEEPGDWGPEAAPCREWSGTDLIFASAVVAGSLRGDK